jgi:hypothetical protein
VKRLQAILPNVSGSINSGQEPMATFNDFRDSLQQAGAPAHLPAPLQALWHEGRGDWKRAHEIVQGDKSIEAAWVHAYLHRKEGDLANAGYWYRRAGRNIAAESLEDEWRIIAASLSEE